MVQVPTTVFPKVAFLQRNIEIQAVEPDPHSSPVRTCKDLMCLGDFLSCKHLEDLLDEAHRLYQTHGSTWAEEVCRDSLKMALSLEGMGVCVNLGIRPFLIESLHPRQDADTSKGHRFGRSFLPM